VQSEVMRAVESWVLAAGKLDDQDRYTSIPACTYMGEGIGSS
jgi:hypothetical protein